MKNILLYRGVILIPKSIYNKIYKLPKYLELLDFIRGETAYVHKDTAHFHERKYIPHFSKKNYITISFENSTGRIKEYLEDNKISHEYFNVPLILTNHKKRNLNLPLIFKGKAAKVLVNYFLAFDSDVHWDDFKFSAYFREEDTTGGYYVGVDNTTGDMNTESFSTKKAAKQYSKGYAAVNIHGVTV